MATKKGGAMHKTAEGAIKAQEILCPLCGKNTYTPYGCSYVDGFSAPFAALSRRDNKTYICSPCGQREGFEDFDYHNIPFVYHVLPQYREHAHAPIAIVVWDRGGYYPTSLDWGDYNNAVKACERVNAQNGHDALESLKFVGLSMRIQNEIGGR